MGDFPALIDVHYGSLRLADIRSNGRTDWSQEFFGRRPPGLIATAPGEVFFITGRHTGLVELSVTIDEADPGAELDAYEDVVEVPFEAVAAELKLFLFDGVAPHALPPLPAGPGAYRIRYHCRGMDETRNPDLKYDDVVDEYLLQIWPAPAAPPATLKVTSRQGHYWMFKS
ncbi:hypothetical protein [Melissospora conviva]|uniref:hypothetical protein n=1 Tax=Melissospora conviva TaxID=3388432 RepID=UPI003C13A331